MRSFGVFRSNIQLVLTLALLIGMPTLILRWLLCRTNVFVIVGIQHFCAPRWHQIAPTRPQCDKQGNKEKGASQGQAYGQTNVLNHLDASVVVAVVVTWIDYTLILSM
jgi:hypothetical protein